MCGIFAYSGHSGAYQTACNGLKNLDYRGYDSWGVAVVNNRQIILEKQTGCITDHVHSSGLNVKKSSIALGHTRWATHGGVTKKNAHPHISEDKFFAIAHNGIVENYDELRDEVIQTGGKLSTQTDTEVILRLVEVVLLESKNLSTAICQVFPRIKGRNAIVILSRDSELFAIRNGSPLIIGFVPSLEEIIISSDSLSFADKTNQVSYVDNNQLIHIKHQKITASNMLGERQLLKQETLLQHENKTSKGKYKHFTLKEIYETPEVISQMITTNTRQLCQFANTLKRYQTIYTIGSGTAGIAAAQISYYLRTISGLRSIALVGAEATSFIPLITKNDVIIAPSQSGETADVLEVLETLKRFKKVDIATYVNMPGASMTRLADYSFLANAGPEKGVMSTKVFSSQIAWGYLLAHAVLKREKQAIRQLGKTAKLQKKLLENKKLHSQLNTYAKELSKADSLFILSKGQNLHIAQEAMIKIIEGSYRHAHAIPAGDLKHFAITILEPSVPVIFIVSEDDVKNDLINAINEVKARKATVFALSPEYNRNFDKWVQIPNSGDATALLNILPFQLMAYYMSTHLGYNPDKPRNIAKSVTVK